MLLNNLSQQFVIAWNSNTFYPDVNNQFIPLMRKQYLPYNTLEDLINSQITSVNFPGVDTPPVSQQIQLHQDSKRNGRDLEQQRQRSLTLTIKTSESLMTYFVCLRQYEVFMKLGVRLPLYMPDISISLLNDGGFQQMEYVFKQLTPVSISTIELSYAARLGTFNTFTWSFNYNYYDVYSFNETGERERITTSFEPIYDFQKEFLDSDKPVYQQRPVVHRPVSTKENMKNVPATGLRSLAKSAPGILSNRL